MMWIRPFLSDLLLKEVNRYLSMRPCLREKQQILKKLEIINFKASHGLERKTGFVKISSSLFLLDNIRMYFYNFFSQASI